MCAIHHRRLLRGSRSFARRQPLSSDHSSRALGHLMMRDSHRTGITSTGSHRSSCIGIELPETRAMATTTTTATRITTRETRPVGGNSSTPVRLHLNGAHRSCSSRSAPEVPLASRTWMPSTVATFDFSLSPAGINIYVRCATREHQLLSSVVCEQQVPYGRNDGRERPASRDRRR